MKYPKAPSSAQMAWIDRAFTQFDQALKGPDSRDPIKGYAAHIEVDDWVNYILFEELVFNLDGYVRSFYLQKDRGGKIRPGPVWDHDLGLGHQFPDGTSFTQWWFVGRKCASRLGPAAHGRSGVRRRRWRSAGANCEKASCATRRSTRASMPSPRRCSPAPRTGTLQRWKILNVESPFTMGAYITIATATYPEQIAALKKFLRERAAWMDGQLQKQSLQAGGHQ